MHTHISGVHVLGAFLGVVIVGTFWRIGAAALTKSENPFFHELGKGMAFQY